MRLQCRPLEITRPLASVVVKCACLYWRKKRFSACEMEWLQEAKRNWESVRKWILMIAGLLSFVLLLRLFPSDFFSHYVGILCEWVASMGYWAPFILGLIDAVGVAICFPLTLAFELAAGFLFGVVPGYVLSPSPPFHNFYTTKF